MPRLKLPKQITMTFTVKLCARIFCVALLMFSLGGKAQMTTSEMNNFKKLDKSREKRMKHKGPNVSSKKRLSSPKKTRQKKAGFSKKRYKLTYFLKEEDFQNMFV